MKVKNESKYYEKNRNKNKKGYKLVGLWAILLTLTLVSAINMISSAFYMKPEIIKKHFIFIIIFFLAFITIGNSRKIFSLGYKKIRLKEKVDYNLLSLRKVNGVIFLGSISVLIFMLLGAALNLEIITKTNGAYGWINLGSFSIQPAEIFKVAFIINIANVLSRAEQEELSNKKILENTLPILFIFGLFIVLQKDLGTTIHYSLIMAFMLFMSNLSMKWIAGFVGIIGTFLGGLVGYFYFFSTSTGYQVARVKSYIDGLIWGTYNNDIGYQVKQSLYAFGSGGFFGKGYFNGVQKYSYIPEIHTDFIMATYGEEFGTIGMIAVIMFFLALFYLIMQVARESKSYFGKYLGIGIAGQIITQVIINIFVAVGLLPVFGIPMPIFSYGGSAMLTMGISLGLVYNLLND